MGSYITTKMVQLNKHALFKQTKNKLTGTFLTTTGDYRYLDGIVTGDSLKLSTFDGAHAYASWRRLLMPVK